MSHYDYKYYYNKTVNNRNEKLDNYYVESNKSKWKLYFIKANEKGTAFSSYDKKDISKIYQIKSFLGKR